MNSIKITAPDIATSDVSSDGRQRWKITKLTREYGMALRWNLDIDSHIGQSSFNVQIWTQNGWVEVWSSLPSEWKYGDKREDESVDDYNMILVSLKNNYLASPYTRNPSIKAASWRKIFVHLAEQASIVLS